MYCSMVLYADDSNRTDLIGLKKGDFIRFFAVFDLPSERIFREFPRKLCCSLRFCHFQAQASQLLLAPLLLLLLGIPAVILLLSLLLMCVYAVCQNDCLLCKCMYNTEHCTFDNFTIQMCTKEHTHAWNPARKTFLDNLAVG